MSRFLLTGLPRIRSAWFATLFQSLGVDTCHDYQARFGSIDALVRWLHSPGRKGWCDPSAACLVPQLTLDEMGGCPVVIINRPVSESKASLELWVGCELPDFDRIAANVDYFKRGADAFTVEYADLERYGTVAHIVRHCAGIALPIETWRQFDLLKIEQHVGKARALYAAA